MKGSMSMRLRVRGRGFFQVSGVGVTLGACGSGFSLGLSRVCDGSRPHEGVSGSSSSSGSSCSRSSSGYSWNTSSSGTGSVGISGGSSGSGFGLGGGVSQAPPGVVGVPAAPRW
jgi:hypothetical protein